MKTLFALLICSISLFSCTQEEIIPLMRVECTLGYTEVFQENIKVHIQQPAPDTVWFSYLNADQYPISGQWIDGRVDWDCIGFTLRGEEYVVTLWTPADTCYFSIPLREQ